MYGFLIKKVFIFQVKISPNLLSVQKENSSTNHKKEYSDPELGTIDLFRHPGSRKVTLIMMIDWIAINLGNHITY